jgi:hypothetical protein
MMRPEDGPNFETVNQRIACTLKHTFQPMAFRQSWLGYCREVANQQ